METEKKMSATKQKRKEDARFSNQVRNNIMINHFLCNLIPYFIKVKRNIK